VPGIGHENYWFRRHEAAYEWACELARGRVLEVGCGEGYGSALLATAADHVLGVDYDALTVAHAAHRYPAVSFVRGNLAALPVASAAIDLLATLQVIEHVWNHPEFVRECRRVLRSDGRLVVTTPNRLTFSPGLDTPVNPFHTVEFTARELAGLLSTCGFTVDTVAGLHAGPRLQDLDRVHGGSFVDAQIGTAPDRWTARLAADVGSVTTADFEVLSDDERDVDSALDLVLVAHPIG
jgi:SAM-dependent methyltransferase